MSQMEWNSMLPSLISLNEDLQKIQNEGISFDVRSGNFVADCVPYLTESKEIKAGKLVFPMNMENQKILKPNDHTAYFVGGKPCEMDGTPIKGLGILEMQKPLFDSVVSNYRFSCYPDKGMYPTYYDKVINYWRVITAPAVNTDPLACQALNKIKLIKPADSKLVYWDITTQSIVEPDAIERRKEKQIQLVVKCFVETKNDIFPLVVEDPMLLFSDVGIVIHSNDKRYKKHL